MPYPSVLPCTKVKHLQHGMSKFCRSELKTEAVRSTPKDAAQNHPDSYTFLGFGILRRSTSALHGVVGTLIILNLYPASAVRNKTPMLTKNKFV